MCSTNFPLVPGHEVVGSVAAVGPGEKNWKTGDRVGGLWYGGHGGTHKMSDSTEPKGQ